MYQEATGRLFSAIEGMKADLEETVPFFMGGREMTRAAANSEVSTQLQRNEMQRTGRNIRNSNNHGDLYRSVQKVPVGHSLPNWVNSHELKGGVLYSSCDCTKRNGLQSDCGRFLCMGRQECLTNPPMCIPSEGLGYISPC